VGYTKILLTDSKFAKLGDLGGMEKQYFGNVEKAKKLAGELKLELVPAMFDIGYSNNMLWHDPNLAEGLPVKDSLFVVKNGEARLVADPHVGHVVHKDRGAAAAGDRDIANILGIAQATDAADDVFSPGDLILDGAGAGINQVQVPPTVAFRDVDQLARVVGPCDRRQADVLAVGGPDEGRTLLVDEIAGLAGVRIDPDQPVALVSAADLLVAEVAPVLVPMQSRGGVVEPIHWGLDGLPGGDVEEIELIGRELVAGQRVGAGPEFGPAAARGRRLDQVDLLPFPRLDPERDERFRVGRP